MLVKTKHNISVANQTKLQIFQRALRTHKQVSLANQVRQYREKLKNDPKYQYLMNPIELEKQVGKLVPLPKLPGNIGAPKGFESPNSQEYFLLSKQRFNVLKEAIDWSTKKKEIRNFGLKFFGPPGVGKSALGLLYVAYGFMNDWMVLPVFDCGNLLGKERESSKYLINLFLDANADLATKFQTHYGQRDFYEMLVNSENEKKSHLNDLLTTLGSIDYPVLYLFDEHNKIFTRGEAHHARWNFKGWNCKTRGQRTLTVYVHSHSDKHLTNALVLQKGEDWRLRYLAPPTREETLELISESNSNMYVPLDKLPREVHQGCWRITDETFWKQFEDYTGRVPQAIIDWVQSSSNAEQIMEQYRKRTLRILKKEPITKPYLYSTVSEILAGEKVIVRATYEWVDHSLFYRDSDNSTKFVSELARKTMEPLMKDLLLEIQNTERFKFVNYKHRTDK